MIYGIGIDLIEIERIKNLQNQTKFIERILTIEERDKLNQYTNEQQIRIFSWTLYCERSI